jgi:hypothetical protein
MADKPDPFGKIRHPKKRAFLAAMANTANVLRAAEIARMDRDNHYLWMKKDPVCRGLRNRMEARRGRTGGRSGAAGIRRCH